MTAAQAALQFHHKRKLREVLAVIGIITLALALRLSGLDRMSLWADEGWSLWFARQSAIDLLAAIPRTETNPPLYYLLLKSWIELFGDSEAALRALSAFIGTGAVALVYLAGRWSSPGAQSHSRGLLAAALFALAFMQLRYAQEARAYALFAFAVAGAFATFLLIVRLERNGGNAPLSLFAIFGAALALTIWSHYTAIFYLAAFAAVSFAWWLWSGRPARRFLGLALTAGVFLVLAGPALWFFGRYALGQAADFWIVAPTARQFADLVSKTFGADFGLPNKTVELALRVFLFAIWPILGLVAAWRSRAHAFVVAALATSVGVFALMAAVSYAVKPVILDRVLIPCQIGWVLLCAHAPMAMSPRWRDATTAAMVLAFATGALSYHLRREAVVQGECWRETAAAILARDPDRAPVIASGAAALLLEYYFSRAGADVAVIYFPDRPSVANADRAHGPRRWFSRRLGDSPAALHALLQHERPAWIVAGKNDGAAAARASALSSPTIQLHPTGPAAHRLPSPSMEGVARQSDAR